MITIRTVIFLLLLHVCFFGYTRKPFVANSTNYDIVYHRICISVNPGVSGAISNGSVTTYFKTTVANVTSLQFDMDGAITASSATMHGSGITYNQNTSTSILTLTIPNIAIAGTLDSVTVYYSGTPTGPGGGIPSGYNYGAHPNAGSSAKAIYTLSEAFTGHFWWPCKETLYDKIDSVDLIVTAPNTYKVAGNGLVTEVASGSNIITTWKTRYPIATYAINFAIGNYSNYQFNITTGGKSLPVMNYLYAENINASFSPDTYKGRSDELKKILPMYVSLFNVDYPYLNEKYGLADCYGNWGALEVPSMTFIGSSNFDKYTVAHEAAHQWFGDMLTTNTWHQIWLNEGFAQYCQSVIFPENLYPSEYPAQQSSLKSSVTSHSNTTVYVPDTTSANAIFYDPSSTGNSQPYNKGAMVLSMLRTWLGTTNFYNALHDYLTAPGLQYKFTHVDSLQKYMQKYTSFSLANFFANWITKPGYAKYAISYGFGTKKVGIKLTQSATSGTTYFDMPVPIRIQNSSGLDTTVIIIDRGGVLYNNVTGATTGTNVINYTLSATPTSITLDPNNVVLATASSYTNNLTLPIYDIELKAAIQNSGVKINWNIQADEPLSQIILEKSSDGVSFYSLTSFNPQVNGKPVLNGDYTDGLPAGAQYYRLKVIKPSGSFLFSRIEMVNNSARNKAEVLPNPVRNDLTLMLPDGYNRENMQMIMRSTTGQLVKNMAVQDQGSNSIKLKANDLHNGMYWITLSNAKQEQLHVCFIKQ